MAATITPDSLRDIFGRGVKVIGRMLNMAGELAARAKSTPPLAFGRPRWENLVLAASLAAFWAGVILKIIG
jgi:hypothetical protein